MTETAVEPGIRYEMFDPNSDAPDDGVTRLTGGLTLYLDDHHSRIRINYLLNGEETNNVDNDEIIAEFQVMF